MYPVSCSLCIWFHVLRRAYFPQALAPHPSNFAKTHARLGRGRLGVSCYIIRFAHHYSPTSVPYEEQEHTNLADAWEAYRLLTEPTSAEVYSQIKGGLARLAIANARIRNLISIFGKSGFDSMRESKQLEFVLYDKVTWN